MTEERRAIDWQAARARLERARRALAAGSEPSPKEARRILRERARALARPLEGVSAPDEMLDLLVFLVGGERYGIEAADVIDVVRLRELTLVPCTPPSILGVVNHRGRILTVLDLRKLLDLAGHASAEGGCVVAVEAAGTSFGILADAIAGTIQAAATDLTPPPAPVSGRGQGLVRGVTPEMVAVLDLEALVRDPRVVVSEEAG